MEALMGASSDGLHISQKELKRVFVETLEIVFTSQNDEQQNFGVGRVIDIFDQIIPNACLYGTAHWIDYISSSVPERHCMCKLFDLVCMHKINEKGTWLTNNPIIDVPNFLPCFQTGIYPYNVHFEAVGGKEWIDLVFDFDVSTFDQDVDYYYCNVSIISRYAIIFQKYEQEEDILYVFDPNPVGLPNYGKFLINPLVSLYKNYKKKLLMDTDDMPTFTLQRAHSYATIAPSEHYRIEVPQIISPSYNPLTQIDYDMINDICTSIMRQSECARTTEVARNLLSKCNAELKKRFESHKHIF